METSRTAGSLLAKPSVKWDCAPDQYHYKGDWILRTHSETGKSEVVAQGPVPNHAIPNSLLDPDRLIFYDGTTVSLGPRSNDADICSFNTKSEQTKKNRHGGCKNLHASSALYASRGQRDTITPRRALPESWLSCRAQCTLSRLQKFVRTESEAGLLDTANQ